MVSVAIVVLDACMSVVSLIELDVDSLVTSVVEVALDNSLLAWHSDEVACNYCTLVETALELGLEVVELVEIGLVVVADEEEEDDRHRSMEVDQLDDVERGQVKRVLDSANTSSLDCYSSLVVCPSVLPTVTCNCCSCSSEKELRSVETDRYRAYPLKDIQNRKDSK